MHAYPRSKIYLTSLNKLLSTQYVPPPEIELASKLFPNRNFSRKLSLTHQRVQSSIQIRQKQSISVKKNCLNPPAKETLALSTNGQPMAKHKSLQLQPSIPDEPTIEELRQSSQVESRLFSTQALRKFTEQSPLPARQSQQPSKKQFLRKGSNLQKKIVINLLRSKLLHPQEESAKGNATYKNTWTAIKRQSEPSSNKEILSMIKVYRGSESRQSLTRKQQRENVGSLSKERQIISTKQIKGWENYGIELEED